MKTTSTQAESLGRTYGRTTAWSVRDHASLTRRAVHPNGRPQLPSHLRRVRRSG
jgi:hypothetical protein